MPKLYGCLLLLGTALLPGAALAQKKPAPPARPRPAAPTPSPYAAVDARMRQVPDSATRTVGGLARYIRATFAGEAERARAAFGWITAHVAYDVDNQYVVEFARPAAEVVQQTLTQRQGVCRDYAELYSALANAVGVPTHVVAGYTGLRAPVAHAWCVSRLDGQWLVLDPTWAAGHVENGRFVFRPHPEYYRMTPQQAIEHHMPFDPLWQLLPAPRTPGQFQQGLVPPPGQPAWAVADSVAQYERQTPDQRGQAASRRIVQNGVKNGLTYTYLGNLAVDTYNEAVREFNLGAEGVNAFVDYFNHQFQPRRPDEELRELLAPTTAHLRRTRELLATVGTQTATRQATQEFVASLQQVDDRLRSCQQFLDRYLRTGRLLRPTLFMNFRLDGSHLLAH